MSRQPRGSGLPVPTSRQNEYFVSRDGIDREVISADICRYLGNDALVRPGHYEDPHTRQTVHGYYITAYRNLTSAMIEDLKADSARWDTERRTQSSRNTSGVQYRMSETHQSRQHHGPTSENHYAQDSYGRDPGYDGPRYPGTGTAGYNGASGPYSQSYSVGGGGGYGYQQQPPHPPPQQSPQPDPRYNGGYSQPPPMDRGYSTAQDGPPGYTHTGAHSSQRGNLPPPTRGYDYPPNPMSSAPTPSQPVYASAPAPQPTYPAPTSPFNNYPGQGPPTGSSYPSMHATDSAFGRGQSSAPPASGFSGQGQFADVSNPRSSVPPPSTVSTGTTATKRRVDRDDDRHTPVERHRQPRR